MADDLFSELIRDVSRRTGGKPKDLPPAGRFEEEVTVKADPSKRLETLFPPSQETMREIMLGSADQPPTGVTFEPRSLRSVPDENYPSMAAAFERLRTKYPYAARNVKRTVGDDKLLGTTAFAQVGFDEPRDIHFNPMLEQLPADEQDKTLEHELTHVGQNANTYGRRPASGADHALNYEAPAYQTESGRIDPPQLSEADRVRYLKAVAAEQLRQRNKKRY